jgi:hypothetical protein
VVAELDGFELYGWVTTAYLLTETAALSLTLDQLVLVRIQVRQLPISPF